MKIKIGTEIARMPRFLYRQAIRQIAKSYDPYHPVWIDGDQLCQGQRECIDRWTVIERELIASESRTLIDLGCAEGYFVEQAALRCGCLALGVDADVRRLSVAQASLILNKTERAGFIYASLTPDFIDQLTRYDTVLFLSVLHHVMYEHGVDYARDYMRRLKPKIGKFMIFDMGQSNETENAWACLLPDMGDEPHSWIEDFLRSVGFQSVTRLGETDAYQGSVRRCLFRVAPE